LACNGALIANLVGKAAQRFVDEWSVASIFHNNSMLTTIPKYTCFDFSKNQLLPFLRRPIFCAKRPAKAFPKLWIKQGENKAFFRGKTGVETYICRSHKIDYGRAISARANQ
jgi:hypothetical protein